MRRLPFALALFSLLAPLSSPTARADWEIKRSPFDPQLVARYKQLLRKDPDDAPALKRLIELYKNYRTLDALTAEYAKSKEAADRIVLGHLLRERGDHAQAAKHYEEALAAHPGDVRAESALADEYVKLKRAPEARPLYEAALKAANDAQRRRPLLRKLADLALAPDRGVPAKQAVAEARGYFDQLLSLDPNDDETRRELGEALASHGMPREAAVEWRKLAARLAKDPARQAEAFRRVGELEEAGSDDAAALKAYGQAFALAPRGHYMRREAADKIIGVHRRKDELRVLAGTWERDWPAGSRGFFEWETLARLYDELGDAPKSQEAFRKALVADPRAIDARRRLIALYEREGKDTDVIAEYRKLIAAAPGEARFRLELAERLWKTPDGSKEAQSIADRLGQETRDPSVHGTLAELYQRWGLPERALAEREKLVRLEPNEESHLVNLGELYFQRGKKDKALEVWKRLLTLPGKREQLLARLAEVYAEHDVAGDKSDLAGQAVELYQKAVKLAPTDPILKKGLASALERMQRYADAAQVWQDLFDQAIAQKQRAMTLEVRQRLLAVLLKLSQMGPQQLGLAARLPWLKQRFDAASDDATASAYGLLVADGFLKLSRLDDAERTLRTLADKAHDDETRADAYVGLAQVHRARHRLKDVIAALEKAAALSPSRARELYSQIAELSMQLYRDADALSYAKKATELGPGDAQAQLRLAEVLEKRDQIDQAVAAYERALELNDRLWKVHFVLARLQLRRGEYARAARLYREVIRRAPEEELVVDAARRAIDLEEYLGTLGELERELSPLAYAHPEKRVYRNLLVELYERYGKPLLPRARSGDAAAQRELQRLGEHGLRPLLDVLVDGETTQQRLAVELLGELQNASATEPLLKLAATPKRTGLPRITAGVVGREGTNAPAIDLRVEAAIAAARLALPKDAPQLAKLATDPEKHVRAAALFGLGRLHEAHATAADEALSHGLSDGNSDVQAVACLGLGRGHASAAARETMMKLLRDPAKPEVTRAACAFALGASATGADERELAQVRRALAETLAEGADDVQRKAAWALGALDARKSASALISAVFVKREEVRQAALQALLAKPGTPPSWVAPERSTDGLDIRGWVARLGAGAAPPAELQPIAWPGFAEEAAAGISDALGRHRDLVLRVLADLDGRAGVLTLGPLTPDGVTDDAAGMQPPASPSSLAPVTADVGQRLLPSLEGVARRQDPTVRARAVAVLAKIRGGLPRVIAALSDSSLEVRLAALTALGGASSTAPDAGKEVTRALERALKAPDWRERRAAALALGAGSDGVGARALPALGAALDDTSGMVREAAARALGATGADGVAPLDKHAGDCVSEVRAAIAVSLGETHAPAARAPLTRLSKDASPDVRSAAQTALQSIRN